MVREMKICPDCRSKYVKHAVYMPGKVDEDRIKSDEFYGGCGYSISIGGRYMCGGCGHGWGGSFQELIEAIDEALRNDLLLN